MQIHRCSVLRSFIVFCFVLFCFAARGWDSKRARSGQITLLQSRRIHVTNVSQQKPLLCHSQCISVSARPKALLKRQALPSRNAEQTRSRPAVAELAPQTRSVRPDWRTAGADKQANRLARFRRRYESVLSRSHVRFK